MMIMQFFRNEQRFDFPEIALRNLFGVQLQQHIQTSPIDDHEHTKVGMLERVSVSVS